MGGFGAEEEVSRKWPIELLTVCPSGWCHTKCWAVIDWRSEPKLNRITLERGAEGMGGERQKGRRKVDTR